MSVEEIESRVGISVIDIYVREIVLEPPVEKKKKILPHYHWSQFC